MTSTIAPTEDTGVVSDMILEVLTAWGQFAFTNNNVGIGEYLTREINESVFLNQSFIFGSVEGAWRKKKRNSMPLAFIKNQPMALPLETPKQGERTNFTVLTLYR